VRKDEEEFGSGNHLSVLVSYAFPGESGAGTANLPCQRVRHGILFYGGG
jgi:hypothetical protein